MLFSGCNYSLRRTDQGWKAWDVVIEGISYVKSFRDDFSTEIDQKGLDEVIARLEAGDTPSAIKGAAGTKGSTDVAKADELLAKIEEINKIFWETKQA